MKEVDEVRQLKKKIFLTAYRAGSAHLASSLSVIDLLYVLYCKGILKYDISDLWNEQRDRLILSKGHAVLAQYVVLNKIGILGDNELNSFCQPGSHLGGEPKLGAVPGIEASTGSLGHGLSFGVGVAMACKMNQFDNRIWVVLGDGECQEGTVWEAAMAAVRFKLDNLTIVMDDNRLQAMDSVENIMGIRSWSNQWKSFGFEVDETDGHDLRALEEILKKKNTPDVPRIVISHTIKGHGISFMENVPIWHYRMPNKRELEIVKAELNITDEELMF